MMDITFVHDFRTTTVLLSSKANLNFKPEATAVCTDVGAPFAEMLVSILGSASTLYHISRSFCSSSLGAV